MKRIVIAAAAALAMLGSAQAQQNSPVYGELGYTWFSFKSEGETLRPQALRGIIGYEFHKNVAGEAMLAVGTRKDSISILGATGDVKLQHAFGLFIKPKYDFGNVEAFARLGWVRAKVKASACLSGVCASASDSDSDFAWGAGLNYRLSPKMSVGADWMRYFDKDGGKADGITVNFGYRF